MVWSTQAKGANRKWILMYFGLCGYVVVMFSEQLRSWQQQLWSSHPSEVRPPPVPETHPLHHRRCCSCFPNLKCHGSYCSFGAKWGLTTALWPPVFWERCESWAAETMFIRTASKVFFHTWVIPALINSDFSTHRSFRASRTTFRPPKAKCDVKTSWPKGECEVRSDVLALKFQRTIAQN